ncbi:MAG TPA: hypothetical protein VGE01_03840 [Fimbriimonas sp.]
MKSADLQSDDKVVRFIEDEGGSYVELPRESQSERYRCSPYHLFQVLQGDGCRLENPEMCVERKGDEVRIEVRGTPVVIPAKCYEHALSEAFGISPA